jgi:hypothetical protein
MAARMEMPRSEPPGDTVVPAGTTPVRSTDRVSTVRSVPASLVMVGVVIALMAAWGGIVAYVGPTFGFSGDGSAAWRWTSSHLFLALLPGILGLVAGLLLICVAPITAGGRGRADLVLLGGATVVSGAWFAVGPWAWPVLRSVGPYFVVASPFHELTFELGYALGPGLVLMAGGGFVIGWAVRHRPTAAAPAGLPTLAAMPTPAEGRHVATTPGESVNANDRPVGVAEPPPATPSGQPTGPAHDGPGAAPVEWPEGWTVDRP